MWNGYSENKLSFLGAKRSCRFKEVLVHIGNTCHRCHGHSKPGPKSNDKYGTAKQRRRHNHDNRNPSGCRNRPQKFDNGINPVADLLWVSACDPCHQSKWHTNKVSQKQQSQCMQCTLNQIRLVIPGNIQDIIHTRHKRLCQHTGFQRQIVISCQQ